MSDRVAIITDIHANMPALEAALERIEQLGIATVYCGGDLVCYDAAAVAREMRAVGLPDELADKLVAAA